LASCVVIVGGVVFKGAPLTDIKDLVCRANAGVLLKVCSRGSAAAHDIYAQPKV
jgi:hypothetical protein